MLKPSLCDYSDAYTLGKGTITIAGRRTDIRQLDERNKEVIFKNYASFTDCICVVNHTQIGNAKDLDVTMPMYNLIEYSHNYSEKSGGLLQYYKNKPNVSLADPESFKSKRKRIGSTSDGDTKNGSKNIENNTK